MDDNGDDNGDDDGDGYNELHHATIIGNEEEVERLVKLTPGLMWKFEYLCGFSPLMLSSRGVSPKIVKCLEESKWLRSPYGHAALHIFYDRKLLPLYKVKDLHGYTSYGKEVDEPILNFHPKMEVWSNIFPMSFLT